MHWFAGVLQSLCSPSKWRAAKGWATHLSREPPLREAGSRLGDIGGDPQGSAAAALGATAATSGCAEL